MQQQVLTIADIKAQYPIGRCGFGYECATLFQTDRLFMVKTKKREYRPKFDNLEKKLYLCGSCPTCL